MSHLIVYGSHYGTTKYYAEQLSKRTGIPFINYKEIKDLADYQVVIHLGGLYAGNVRGLKNTLKRLPQKTDLIIVTVGLSDVTDPKTIEAIRSSINNQVPKERLDRTTLFHLRGGIDYKHLKLSHRLMMMLLYYRCRSVPEEKQTPDVKGIIETFNKKISFVKNEDLDPIVQYIKSESKN